MGCSDAYDYPIYRSLPPCDHRGAEVTLRFSDDRLWAKCACGRHLGEVPLSK